MLKMRENPYTKVINEIKPKRDIYLKEMLSLHTDFSIFTDHNFADFCFVMCHFETIYI